MPSAFDRRFWLEDIFNCSMSHMIGWIKFLWGWEWSVYVHLYGYVWRTFALSYQGRQGFRCRVSVQFNSPIVIGDGFYLQEYFWRYFVISSSKPFRHCLIRKWGFVLNSESRGRLRHLTDWPWKIDHIPVPSRSLPRIIFKKVSLSK